MKQTKADTLIEKTQFNSYDDYKIHPTADLKCPKCREIVSIAFKDLEKHQLSNFSNLTKNDESRIEEFIKKNTIETPNSFIDYYCPTCNQPIRLYYDSWAGGRHGEYGYELKLVISD